MVITRPHEGSRHVTYPYRLGAPPVFSQLVVGNQEAAVFRRHGAVLGMLRGGQYSISPTGTPFLEVAKSGDGRSYQCDLIFVTTGPTRLGLDGPVGTLTDVSGHPAEFILLGAATVQTRDPVRVVSQGIGVGEAGDAFDRIIYRRLMQGIQKALPGVLEGGRASPQDLVGVARAVLEAGRADQLGVDVLGLEVLSVEISRLASARGLAPAGRDAGDRRAQLAADEELPKHQSCRFGATRVPFWDGVYGMNVHVSTVGHFEGDRVPGHQEQWLADMIVSTIRHAAAGWQGTVLDLPGRRDEWARYVTSVVVPHLTKHTGLRGRVVIEAIELDGGEHAELKRRRAAALIGGR